MTKIRYVDFDGTLAHFDGWVGPTAIGEPVNAMFLKVKKWLRQGDEVVIFTSRIAPNDKYTPLEHCEAARKAIEDWCVKYFGQKLRVTCEKNYFDICYDDLTCNIVRNTGRTSEGNMLHMINDMRNYPNHNDSGILDYIVRYLEETVKKQNE
jgi:hypothetical protein